MRCSYALLSCSFLLFTALGGAPVGQAQSPDNNWVPISGVNGGLFGPGGAAAVLSDVDDAGRVYVALPTTCPSPYPNCTVFARWDGQQWQVLPGAVPSTAVQRTLALAASPGGDYLYVGGTFQEAFRADGTIGVFGQIARIEIATGVWDVMDNGFAGSVNALDVDASGNLYAGGDFVIKSTMPPGVRNVARWNPAAEQWEALGGGVGPVFQGVDVLEVEPNGNVVMAGPFTEFFDTPNGTAQPVNHIARFDVSAGQWQALGNGLDVPPFASGLASDGTNVTLGGDGLVIGGVTDIAFQWDGTAWQGFSTGLAGDVAYSFERDGQGTLYALTNGGGAPLRLYRLAAAGTWEELASVGGPLIFTTAANPRFNGADLYLGGAFTQILDAINGATVSADGHARWNGASFVALQGTGGSGVTGTVFATNAYSPTVFGPYHNYQTSGLAVGGDITQVAFQAVGRVAVYDGVAWDDPGLGVTDPNGTVRAVEIEGNALNTAVEQLVIGGQFVEVSNEDGTPVAVSNVARWEDATQAWSSIGQGVSVGGVPGTGIVHALALWDDLGEFYGERYLYVGGEFDTATNTDGTTVAVNNLARYNLFNQQWEAVVGGVDGPVHALEVTRALASEIPLTLDHTLFVGGDFAQALDGAGAPVNDTHNLARLATDDTWRGVGKGTNGPVFALAFQYQRVGVQANRAIDGGLLYVGGGFTNVTDGNGPVTAALNLAKWSATYDAWTPIGLPFQQGDNGVNGPVRSLQIVLPETDTGLHFKATVIVGGDFTEAYDDTGAIVFANRLVKLIDLDPRSDFFAPGVRPSRQLFTPYGGGLDGLVRSATPIHCGAETVYVGGEFDIAGTSPARASRRLVKWRAVYPPTPGSFMVGGSGGGCAAPGRCQSSIEFIPPICPNNNLGRTAGGAVDLAPVGFGEVVPLAAGLVPFSQVLDFEVTDADGETTTVPEVFTGIVGPVAYVLTGVDDPAQYAPNPDGRSTAFSLRAVQVGGDGFDLDGRVRLRVFNAVTDAPAVEVALSDGTSLADGLPYDSLGGPAEVLPGSYTVEVRRSDDGTVLGSLPLTLADTTSAQVLILAGFLDPAANQNGPPLTLIPVTQGSAVPTALEPTAGLPVSFMLHPAYPNPFALGTTLRFDAARSDEVTMEVFDLLGRRVAVLMDEQVEAGRQTIRWDAGGLASGVYIVRMRVGEVMQAQRVTLLR